MKKKLDFLVSPNWRKMGSCSCGGSWSTIISVTQKSLAEITGRVVIKFDQFLYYFENYTISFSANRRQTRIENFLIDY